MATMGQTVSARTTRALIDRWAPPDPAHGPVDPRPRPAGAPLIFTLLGVVGGGALFYGQRHISAEGNRR